jgi:hypothetical protein
VKWSGLNYSAFALSFNNNSLLVCPEQFSDLFFTAPRFIQQPVNVLVP